MARYLAYRLSLVVPLFIGAAFLIFLAGHFAPGDPVQVLLGDRYNPATAAQLRHELGLDRPLLVQFAAYLGGLATFDFGTSNVNPGVRVGDLIARALPISVSLAVLAVALAAILGVVLGLIAAVTSLRLLDRFIQALVVSGLSVPNFVVAAVVVLVFALHWRWLPVAGWGKPQHYVLPVVVLAGPPLAFITRITRSSVGVILGEDYIRTAWSKGLGRGTVLARHVLRNAALPVVTTIGLAFGNAIVGAFIVEVVFNVPGIARVAVNAILQRDYIVLQTVVVTYTALFTLVNLLVDVSYAFLNPRVQY